MYLITAAGEPAKIECFENDFVTVELAPTTEPSPKITPGSIATPIPIKQLSKISVFLNSSLRLEGGISIGS